MRDEPQRCPRPRRHDLIRYELLGRRSRSGLFPWVNASMPEHVMLTSRGSGAFGAHPDHDAHLLSTLSAIQILMMQDALDRLDIPRVVKCTCILRRHVYDVLTCKAFYSQTFCPCSSHREFLPEMRLARSTRVSCIVRSTRCPYSATCTSWTWRKPSGTFDSAGILMAALVPGRVPKAMQPWVCPVLRPCFSAATLTEYQCLYV